MEFMEDGDELVSTWVPDTHYEGYLDILHGGIQSTMMDEIASWVVFIKLETGGVTSRLTTRFRRPVHISHGAVELRAKLQGRNGRIATIDVKLFNGKAELCSESVVEYFVMTPEKAAERMRYPGVSAFYD